MSKHTPGPWKFDTLTEIGGRRMTCIYADTPDSPGGKTIVIRTGTVRGDTELANVKLATAAPELLEALIKAVTRYEATLATCPHRDETRLELVAARAAIAKATAD